MNKISIPKIDFPMGPFPFPLCFDMTMAQFLSVKGIDFRSCFSGCYAVEFHPEEKQVDRVLVFPGFDRKKYEDCGIKAIEHQVPDHKQFLAYLKEQIANGLPVAVHFDGYYCPWDWNLYRKGHNRHIVLVSGVSRFGRRVKVCDLLFHQHQRTVRTSRLLKACSFYFSIEVQGDSKNWRNDDVICCLTKAYKALSGFLACAKLNPGLLALESNDVVSTKLFCVLQQGRISHHFYSLYLRYLFELRNETTAKYLYEQLSQAQYAWGDCLFYILRSKEAGNYSTQEMIRYLGALVDRYRVLIEQREAEK